MKQTGVSEKGILGSNHRKKPEMVTENVLPKEQ